ncbi:MAG: PIN domain-containing protein [Victivallales bacterium]|nr:PIN domain-containing protein [Victivallales bacterium]
MLFDSDVLIWMFRGSRKAAQMILDEPERKMSIINYMEVLQGAKNKIHLLTMKHNFMHLHFDILPVTEAISHRASILVEEHALFDGLHVTDALIAATACEHHLTLCTANQKHMKNIAGLDFLLFTP